MAGDPILLRAVPDDELRRLFFTEPPSVGWGLVCVCVWRGVSVCGAGGVSVCGGYGVCV